MERIYMPSNLKRRISSQSLWVLAGITVLSVGSYLVYSGVFYHFGFPLDDAWIHQTYARNLAVRGEWSFIPGQPSGGSTSPLWSALLAIGFWLKLAPYFWTYFLGGIGLWLLAVVGESAVRQLIPSYCPKIPWVGAALALEWHLVWAAASGMETLLFSLLMTVSLVQIILGTEINFRLGLIIGISCWVRPEGITLLGPAVLLNLLTRSPWSQRLRRLVNLGVGFGSVFALYLLFNLFISHLPFPNTFYAKQAEYLEYLNIPFLVRWGREITPALEGAGIFLLPGFVITLISAFRRRNWGVVVAAAWVLGFLAVYAWRLPVTYQYGRYVIPSMPVFFLLGLMGLAKYSSLANQYWQRIFSFSWRMAVGAVLIVFWVVGAIHYARDVAFIEGEMVSTAKWVAAEIPPTDLIAVHDIGAMGFFGNHDLVDLAGLVSREVIPFLRDENQIAAYLNRREVKYLITFPNWYQQLTRNLRAVHSTNAPYAPVPGEGNMTVYQWSGP